MTSFLIGLSLDLKELDYLYTHAFIEGVNSLHPAPTVLHIYHQLRPSSRRACCSWSWRAASTALMFSCAHWQSERIVSISVVRSGVSTYSTCGGTTGYT